MTIKTLSTRITNDLSFEILLPEQSFFYHITLEKFPNFHIDWINHGFFKQARINKLVNPKLVFQKIVINFVYHKTLSSFSTKTSLEFTH